MRFKQAGLGAVGALAIFVSSGCGDLVRQGTSPSQLVIDSLTADGSATLQSDVLRIVDDVPTQFSDAGTVSMRVIMKDVTGTAPSPVNAVTIDRYRVTFERTDGRNTPGVDVPFPFDSAVTVTVTAASTTFSFELIRHVAKAEAPLASLVINPVIISTIATVTFFGHDQTGNEVSATGRIGIQFGNFADEE